jgi:two-component system response regulator HydG
MSALKGYRWPGNVRELKNCVDAMRLLSPGPEVKIDDVPFQVRAERPKPGSPWDQRPILKLEQMTEEYVLYALQRCSGNKSQAARLLGIDPKTLYKRLRKPE